MKTFIHFILLSAACIVLMSCSRLVKEEPYLSANSSTELTPVESMDLPRTTNSLLIPQVNASGSEAAPDSKPPEMAFAKRRGENENVVIIESGGMPTIEIFNEKEAWNLMMSDLGNNWLLLDEDQENCQATYRFYDPINEEDESRGFFKRLFTLKSNYADQSGEYILTCLQLPQKQQIWLQTMDFEAPSSYVTDNMFNLLFEAATAE